MFLDPLLTPGIVLDFPALALIFAEKPKEMKTIEDDFCTFVRFLENTPVRPDYPAVCRLLHINPGVLDDYLIRELGMCGDELMMHV